MIDRDSSGVALRTERVNGRGRALDVFAASGRSAEKSGLSRPVLSSPIVNRATVVEGDQCPVGAGEVLEETAPIPLPRPTPCQDPWNLVLEVT